MANTDDSVQTTIRLGKADRENIDTITESGIAQNTAEAIRAGLAALAYGLVRPAKKGGDATRTTTRSR